MTLEQFKEYQERSFDAFCKAVIRNEAIDIHRKMTTQARKEVPLSSLSQSELASLCYEDTYHPVYKVYYVQGRPVRICDQTLAEVLQHLSPARRDVILLYYFLNYSNSDIARLLHISSPTVNNRKHAALKKLKGLLEEIDNV